MPTITNDPKKRFQENKERVSKHRDLVDSGEFKDLLDVALLSLINDTQDTGDPVMAAAGFHRVMGARAMAKALLNLAEVPTVPTTQPNTGNLNHRP